MLHFQVHITLFTQHETCAQDEVEGGSCCAIFKIFLMCDFICAPNPGFFFSISTDMEVFYS